ncbi:hypothetical protein IMCC20628_03588 [Hoeflea sp. IMCC20628]|nr:hypothetical protein IMCC20628_03588 [Hoeflea sp. IMCC20628]
MKPKDLTSMEMLQEIHSILKAEVSTTESGTGEIDKLGSLLTSILRLQTQQIDLLRGLSERVGRITPR